MKKNPFVQGAMIATIGIVISKILGIIYVIPFYAVIGESGGALYGYAYTIYSIFLNLSSIGIPLAISRLTSEYNALEQYHLKERAFKIGKKVIMVLSIISFISLMILAPTIARIFIGDIKGGNTISDVAFVIRVIATAILIVPSLSVTKGYLQGHKYIAAATMSQVIEQFARVIIIIAGSYISVKVLGFPIKVGVGVATFGATFGGLIAYLYLLFKIKKNEHQLNREKVASRETIKISSKDITLKILSYAIPFILSSLVFSFYDFVDLSTVIKTLVDKLHYNIGEAETVMSIISTWGSKLNMIIASIATGLVTSLIPNISGSFVKKDYVDVRNKINRSLQILLFITVPMTVGLSLLAKPVWTIFYGYNTLSSMIFQYYVFIALFNSVITTLNVIMQSLNEQKKLFVYLAIGLMVKIIFNIPLMYSFERMGLHAGYGVITATILGFSTSIVLQLICLYKKIGVNYEETVKRFITIIYACMVMSAVILICQLFVPFTVESRVKALILTCVFAVIGSVVYIFITARKNLLTDILGKSFVNKILNKLKIKVK
jgi:O-antigen/teichoic acid export membrane protein